MRPLTEDETRVFFEKLSKYIGENIKDLIDRSDGVYCFRLHRERVFYVSERIMKQVRRLGALFPNLRNPKRPAICFLPGRQLLPREPYLPRHVLRKIYQIQEISSAHHRPGLPGSVRSAQNLAQSLRRATGKFYSPENCYAITLKNTAKAAIRIFFFYRSMLNDEQKLFY